MRCVAGWFSSFQHPGHRAHCAQQANESILNEEVQVDSYIIPGLLSSEWICTAMTNGRALGNVGGLPFFNHLKRSGWTQLICIINYLTWDITGYVRQICDKPSVPGVINQPICWTFYSLQLRANGDIVLQRLNITTVPPYQWKSPDGWSLPGGLL